MTRSIITRKPRTRVPDRAVAYVPETTPAASLVRPRTRVPDRAVAYVPETTPAASLVRTVEPAVADPKLGAYLLVIEHAEDVRNQLAITKGRMKAVLQRQLRVLEESARAARVAAGLP